MDNEHYVAHLREEANYEIARLEALLRDPRMTVNDREIALDMLSFYQEAMADEEKAALILPQSTAVPKREDEPSSNLPQVRVQVKAA